MYLRLALAADILSSHLAEFGVQSPTREARIVSLHHAFRIPLGDGRRVGVHGVQKELHGRNASALRVPSIVVRE